MDILSLVEIKKILLSSGIVLSLTGLIIMIKSASISRTVYFKKPPFFKQYGFGLVLTLFGAFLQVAGIWSDYLLGSIIKLAHLFEILNYL